MYYGKFIYIIDLKKEKFSNYKTKKLFQTLKYILYQIFLSFEEDTGQYSK